MPKINVAPTKSSYLSIMRDLTFAKEGYELLEQKRQILVMELMAQLAGARRAQADVEEKMKAAFAALAVDMAERGALNLGGEALASTARQRIELGERNVMGITLASVTAETEKPGPQTGLGTGSTRSDEVIKRFHEALEAITRMAEVENAVIRVARELKKTQRRVNALEKVFIPDYKETIKYILEALEEREREGFVVMRMLKKR